MINKIVLNNFKCFDSIEIPLKTLTLLAGSNGSGKSTIIQALLLARQSFLANTNCFEFVGKYITLGYSNDVLYEFNEKENPQIEISLFDEDGNSKLIADYINDKSKLELNSESFFANYKTNCFNASFEYISAERISPEKIFYTFNDSNNIGIHGENVMNYLNLYGDKKVSLKGFKELTITEYINNWLSRMFNGFILNLEELKKADMVKFRFQEVASNDKSNERRPINVGFGITYVLPVLVALLKAKPNDLVIIENPECHLHPKAQRLIGELISVVAQNGVQIIIETHSDHVLNGIRLSVKQRIIKKELTQILFTKREDVGSHYYTSVYKPNILDNGDLDVWPEGFFDEWDNALVDLLE